MTSADNCGGRMLLDCDHLQIQYIEKEVSESE